VAPAGGEIAKVKLRVSRYVQGEPDDKEPFRGQPVQCAVDKDLQDRERGTSSRIDRGIALVVPAAAELGGSDALESLIPMLLQDEPPAPYLGHD
jgi:hypothetical protein